MQQKCERLYIWTIICVGFALVVAAVYSAVRQYALVDVGDYLRQTLYLTFICAVCRSLPVFLSNNKAMDLSVISILMTYLTMGAAQAITVYTLSTFFTFSFNEPAASMFPASTTATRSNRCSIWAASSSPWRCPALFVA